MVDMLGSLTCCLPCLLANRSRRCDTRCVCLYSTACDSRRTEVL